jgi:hypothetical protein
MKKSKESNPREVVTISCLKPGEDRLLTTKEAAPVLGLAPVTLNIDRVKGALGIPFVKIGNKAVRYRSSDLLTWMSNLPGRSSTSQNI